MKLLTATNRTQGYRANDFDWCIKGELVHIGDVCAADREDPDGRCGCGRSFAGLNSHQATTTAMIRDVPGFTVADFVEALRSSLDQQGWDPSDAAREAAALCRLAGRFPAGTVLERRLDRIAVRRYLKVPGGT